MRRSLFKLAACCRVEFALAFVVALMLVPVNLIQPNMNRFLMDYFLVEGYLNWGPPLVAFGVFVLFLTLGGTYLWETTKLSLCLRFVVVNASVLVRRLLSLPVAFFQTRLAGALAARVNSVVLIADFMSESLVEGAIGILSLVCFGVLLVSYDALLGSFAVLLALGVLFLLARGGKACSRFAADAQRRHNLMTGIATHALSMIETVKASGLEDGFFNEWSDLYTREQRPLMGLSRCSLDFCLLQAIAQRVGLTAIICLGALRILDGSLSCGAYVAFQLVVGCFFTPLETLVQSYGQLQDIFAKARDVTDVLDQPKPREGKAPSTADVRRLDGAVELRDVTFGYDRSRPPLLEHFNLKVSVGERVAIVGISGSGKSTVAKLIAGTYEPWSGEVLFDGRPRSSYTAEELRFSFAMVDQDVVMFPGTVRENLSMYDGTIPFETVRRAASDAMIHESIIARTGGYEAELDSSGSNFSGGERQRMEIARALAVDPSILLLDEATAALDPVTEEKLDLNLRRRGVTTLVIAHRLSTIRDADRIVVLEKGRIAEKGRHDELLKLNGTYAELVTA